MYFTFSDLFNNDTNIWNGLVENCCAANFTDVIYLSIIWRQYFRIFIVDIKGRMKTVLRRLYYTSIYLILFLGQYRRIIQIGECTSIVGST